MTFNTGNNVPSTDPRDLYDNAENLDKLVNGADPFYADRKGVLRESWAGMENSFNNAQEGRETAFTLSQADKESRFQAFLVSAGYASKGDYAASVVLAERNEYVAVDAATTGTSPGLYRPNAAATLPLTLTGTWATDSANLVLLGDDVLRQELAAVGGASLVGFSQGSEGAIPRDVSARLKDYVSVKDFGAVGDGVTDDTAAFNLATQAAYAWTGGMTAEAFENAPYREIYIPAGRYRIDGKVYVRKSQHLRGAGAGSTFLIFQNTTESENLNTGGIVLGRDSAGVVDPTGLAPMLSDFICSGGQPAIEGSVNGVVLRSLFVSSPVIGIDIGGTDWVITNCIMDSGSVLIRGTNAGNVSISNSIFYLGNQQIYLNGGCADWTVSNCEFNYPRTQAVLVQGGDNRNINFSGCSFMMNGQYPEHLGFINNNTGSGDSLYFNGCSFRNGYGPVLRSSQDSYFRFSGCVADGITTRPTLYNQGSTMWGVQLSGLAKVDIDGCAFKNLYGRALVVAGANTLNVTASRFENCANGVLGQGGGASSVRFRNVEIDTTAEVPLNFYGSSGTAFEMHGGSFRNTAGDGDVQLSSTTVAATTVLLDGVTGSGRKIFSRYGAGKIIMRGLKGNWWGATTTGARKYIRIPFSGAMTFQVALTANPTPGTSALYSKTQLSMVGLTGGLDSSTVKLFVDKTTVYESGARGIAALDVQVDLGTLGAGQSVTATEAAYNGDIVLSWPTTYAQESLVVTPVAGQTYSS